MPGQYDDTIREAMRMYPTLNKYGVNSVRTPMEGDNRMLEFWPPDETGDEQYQRPQELPMGSPGVQIISPDTSARDVAGDIISHYAVNQDPKLSALYQQFSKSFDDPAAQSRLQEDYKWSQQNEQESRPFNVWKDTTRIPDYMRGYMFKQWPQSAIPHMFTPEQTQTLDQMDTYLQGPFREKE